MIFEVGDEAVTAGFIKFGKDVVEENKGTFGGFLADEVGFGEFERENNSA